MPTPGGCPRWHARIGGRQWFVHGGSHRNSGGILRVITPSPWHRDAGQPDFQRRAVDLHEQFGLVDDEQLFHCGQRRRRTRRDRLATKSFTGEYRPFVAPRGSVALRLGADLRCGEWHASARRDDTRAHLGGAGQLMSRFDRAPGASSELVLRRRRPDAGWRRPILSAASPCRRATSSRTPMRSAAPRRRSRRRPRSPSRRGSIPARVQLDVGATLRRHFLAGGSVAGTGATSALGSAHSVSTSLLAGTSGANGSVSMTILEDPPACDQ